MKTETHKPPPKKESMQVEKGDLARWRHTSVFANWQGSIHISQSEILKDRADWSGEARARSTLVRHQLHSLHKRSADTMPAAGLQTIDVWW